VTISAKEFDFHAARMRLEGKAKSAGEKLTSLEDAVARVHDGDHVAIGGCLYSRTPLALIWALLRRRPHGLTLSRNLMSYEGEWAVVAGAADKLVTSWMGIGLPWGLSRIQREYVESGRIAFEEWSHLAIGLRYHAGGDLPRAWCDAARMPGTRYPLSGGDSLPTQLAQSGAVRAGVLPLEGVARRVSHRSGSRE